MTLSVFDKGANPDEVSVEFEPRKVRIWFSCTRCVCSIIPAAQLTYKHGDKVLELQPLKGQIDPAQSSYTVGKVKVEIRLHKVAIGRWGALTGDSPDRASPALTA